VCVYVCVVTFRILPRANKAETKICFCLQFFVIQGNEWFA